MDRRVIPLDPKIFSMGEVSQALPLRLREVLTLAMITRVYLHMTGEKTVTVPHLDQPVIFHAVECFKVFTFRGKQCRQ